MLKVGVLAAFLLVALTACSNKSDDGGTAVQSVTPEPTGLPPSLDPVGRVDAVIQLNVERNGVRTTDDESLFAGDSLESDADGTFDFAVEANETTCRSLTNVKLTVYPQPDVVIRFYSGITTCNFASSSAPAEYMVGDLATLRTSGQTVFSVQASADSATIIVASGSVVVDSLVAPSTFTVTRQHEIEVFFDAPPIQPRPITIDPSMIDRFRPFGPEILVPPTITSDPRLKGLLDQEVIKVGFDPSAAANLKSTEFLETYIATLGEQLGIEVELVPINPSDADGELDQGRIDLFIAPSQALRSLDAIPLFADERDVTWGIASAADAGEITEVLSKLQTATVLSGRYSDLYEKAFEVEPTYDLVIPPSFPQR